MTIRTAIVRFQSSMRILDWLLGAASLSYGLYAHSWLWIASGFLGFALAWYNPGARLQKKLSMIKPARPANGTTKR
jgi:hypothetical protein